MKPRWYCRPVSPHGMEYVGTSHHSEGQGTQNGTLEAPNHPVCCVPWIGWPISRGAVASSHRPVRTWLAWLAALLFH